ncbi:MAG: thioredoxin reductase (NADPH) [Natronomonas sp.]|jgi:thioredoxin reductase (NADPH)
MSGKASTSSANHSRATRSVPSLTGTHIGRHGSIRHHCRRRRRLLRGHAHRPPRPRYLSHRRGRLASPPRRTLRELPCSPAGVNGRQLLDLLAEQAERAGCRCVGVVTRVGWVDTRFAVETAAGERHTATVSSPRQRPRSSRRKQSLDTDECGRTGVDGPCAAGSPGALTKRGLCRSRSRGGCDSPRGRRPAALLRLGHTGGLPHRPLSTGCEGVDETERREREAVSPAVMRDRFAEPHPDHQATHASLEE